MMPISEDVRQDFLADERAQDDELEENENLDDYDFPHSGCMNCVYNGGDLCKRRRCIYLEDL